MNRPVPAARAAASRLSVPVVRSWLVTAKSLSKLRKSFSALSEVIWWMMTSGLARPTAVSTASASRPSTMTGVAPSRRISVSLTADRVVPVTSWPAAVSNGTRRCPMTPAAPATNTRMMAPFPAFYSLRHLRQGTPAACDTPAPAPAGPRSELADDPGQRGDALGDGAFADRRVPEDQAAGARVRDAVRPHRVEADARPPGRGDHRGLVQVRRQPGDQVQPGRDAVRLEPQPGRERLARRSGVDDVLGR